MNEDRSGSIRQRPVLRASVVTIAMVLVAGLAAEASAQGAFYVYTDQTGLARAFCAAGQPLVGGGFSEKDEGGASEDRSLRQTYPISDSSGVGAYGSTAIGWQAASEDFTHLVRAFAVCADARLAAATSVQYVSAAATGMARAYCPAGTRVIGGGGYVGAGKERGVMKLRQTYPISDETGVIAYGRNAIGWQAASSDFTNTVVAFAVCDTGGKLDIEYRSAQDTLPGFARVFCPAGTTVTAGGGFVEASPYAAVGLRSTLPISDATGVHAYGRTAIGWQTSSSNFANTVVAFAVCVSGA